MALYPLHLQGNAGWMGTEAAPHRVRNVLHSVDAASADLCRDAITQRAPTRPTETLKTNATAVYFTMQGLVWLRLPGRRCRREDPEMPRDHPGTREKRASSRGNGRVALPMSAVLAPHDTPLKPKRTTTVPWQTQVRKANITNPA